MLRSLLNAQRLDLGFQSQGVLTGQLFLPANKYPVDPVQYRAVPVGARPDVSKPATFITQLVERIAAIPGVESAAAVSSLPLNPVGIDYDMPVIVEGRPQPRPGEEPQADLRIVTPGYFRTMRIPLISGRAFDAHDGPAAAPVIIVNETLARQMFAGEDPVGRRLQLYGRAREIIGVVGSVRHHGFNRDPRPEMILPNEQFQFGGMTLVARSGLDPVTLGAAMAREVHALDPELPLSRVTTLDQYLATSVSQPRFTTFLLISFAGVAVLLALVGVYGVMAYAVSQRRREIGVRIALGADRQDVVWMVVGHGMVLAGIGIAAGLAGAAAGTRLMEDLLFGVTATDPLTFALAAAALGLASLAAAYVPAWRAARVAPATALRSE
jgi:putative ABC transport system permease protein